MPLMATADDLVAKALTPLQEMLAAEDYRLWIGKSASPILRLTVTAGPSACAYCLVPKATLTAIARDHLARAGVSPEMAIEVIYPEDGEPGS